MIYSMTGFATLERDTAYGKILIELRSVNHRYLETHIKLDEHFRSFEPFVRDFVGQKLGRGKVEIRISLMQTMSMDKSAELNLNILSELAKLSNSVFQHFPTSPSLTVSEILHWPGVLINQAIDNKMLEADLKSFLSLAIVDLLNAKAREGEKLKGIILERLVEIENQIDQLKPLLPMQIKTYQDKLTAKLKENLKSLDQERIQQELVLYAQRMDVDEELTRLSVHLNEVRRILEKESLVGKKLDFLMQELNREANTLGSKSVSIETSQVSMMLKVLIEQMREQIQNLE